MPTKGNDITFLTLIKFFPHPIAHCHHGTDAAAPPLPPPPLLPLPIRPLFLSHASNSSTHIPTPPPPPLPNTSDCLFPHPWPSHLPNYPSTQLLSSPCTLCPPYLSPDSSLPLPFLLPQPPSSAEPRASGCCGRGGGGRGAEKKVRRQWRWKSRRRKRG